VLVVVVTAASSSHARTLPLPLLLDRGGSLPGHPFPIVRAVDPHPGRRPDSERPRPIGAGRSRVVRRSGLNGSLGCDGSHQAAVYAPPREPHEHEHNDENEQDDGEVRVHEGPPSRGTGRPEADSSPRAVSHDPGLT
jgi:hypothetical protein